MKSKRGKIIFTGVIILVLVIAAFVYKQPVEIEDIHKDWDFDECTSIDFYAKYGTDGKYHITVNGRRISIDKNDPWLREVFDTAVKYAEADEQKPAA